MVIQKTGYKKSNNEMISMKLDLNAYDMLCRFVLQENKCIRLEHLVALRNLINSINPVNYENDPELLKRVNFIKKGLEARIDENLNDRDIVLNYINGGISFELDFIDYDRLILSKAEIDHIIKFIYNSLKWNFIYAYGDNLTNTRCT